MKNEEVLAALSAAMPSDIQIKEVYTPQTHFKEIAWAQNEIDFHVPVEKNVLAALEKEM